MIRLTKIFTFETAHALWGYDGKCKNIHGHSYKLYVTVKGEPCNDIHHVKNGMVMDFGELKSIVKKLIINPLDHAIILNAETEHKQLGEQLQNQGHKVIFMNCQPTCENMLMDFAEKIQSELPENILLAKLKLYETETSYGEWIREDQ